MGGPGRETCKEALRLYRQGHRKLGPRRHEDVGYAVTGEPDLVVWIADTLMRRMGMIAD